MSIRQEILHLHVKIIDVAPPSNGMVRVTAQTPDGGIFNCKMKQEEAEKFQWGDDGFSFGFDEEEVKKYKLQKYLQN